MKLNKIVKLITYAVNNNDIETAISFLQNQIPQIKNSEENIKGNTSDYSSIKKEKEFFCEECSTKCKVSLKGINFDIPTQCVFKNAIIESKWKLDESNK